MSRLVGKSRDGKGEEEEDRDEEEGKKGEAQLSYPSQDPPPGYCRGSPQSPPAKILAPGGPLGARIRHQLRGVPNRNYGERLRGPGIGEFSY